MNCEKNYELKSEIRGCYQIELPLYCDNQVEKKDFIQNMLNRYKKGEKQKRRMVKCKSR